MNRQAIALAADSAVTVGKKRVWKGMNKLFSLGPVNDIAIMVYNSADFIGYPWEIIIKSFRTKIGSKSFNSVSECADSFQKFLADERFHLDESIVKSQLIFFVEILDSLKERLPKTPKKIEKRNAIKEIIKSEMDTVDAIDKITNSYDFNDFCNEYKNSSIDPLIKDVFGALPKSITLVILRYLYEMWIRKFRSPYFTGIIFAGYGKGEYFPCVVALAVDGKDKHILRCWRDDKGEMSISIGKDKSMVLAFGQGDITELFMEGTERSTKTFISRLINRILDDKSERLINDYIADADERLVELVRQKQDNRIISDMMSKELTKFGRRKVAHPILEVVRALPKEELAAMARALVEVTALRRKMDSALESVGGPVDVAVISKGDGLIWIDRKHYFNLEKNRDYLDRKKSLRRDDDG